MVSSNLKTCPVCERLFDISLYTDYAYKKSINGRTVFYCGYNCMRVIERQREKKRSNKVDN